MEQLAQLLSQAERRLTQALGRILAEHGCTVGRWRALAVLADGEPHPMSELAEFALVPAPTLTRLVDGMVADNLAYRKADPHDRRRVLVHITARGRRLHRRLATSVEEAQPAILAEADAGSVEALAALLRELMGGLRPAP